ncbi:MAG: nucleoside triphosphate pyrophosphohydrolase [Candidatus Riflebacteria bacterium]|nr:nucleoside triphosphate pyrophosphohydrolase [Candidatus Riflebacteria bacterium]
MNTKIASVKASSNGCESTNSLSETNSEVSEQFLKLIDIIDRLRAPDGCPWDREQTTASMMRYLKEETDEAIEAITNNDPIGTCEELGDVLMLIVFHAHLAKESGMFSIKEVISGINKKLIDRHPHVFKSDAPSEMSSGEVVEKWKDLKVVEKKENRRISSRMRHLLNYQSAIVSARVIQEEAKNVGFDFPSLSDCMSKIYEEAAELEKAAVLKNRQKMLEELGDVLFSCVNTARLLQIDPEEALKISNKKFVERFSKIEEKVEDNGGWEKFVLSDLDEFWEASKVKP